MRGPELLRIVERAQKDPQAALEESRDLKRRASNAIERIKTLINDRNALHLVIGLALKDISRVSSFPNYQVSNLAGHGRLLRHFAVSCSEDLLWPPAEAAPLDELLSLSEVVFESLFYGFMTESQAAPSTDERDAREAASVAVMLSTWECELHTPEQAESRCRGLYEAEVESIVVPSLGFTLDKLFAGLAAVHKALEGRLGPLDELALRMRAARPQMIRVGTRTVPFLTEKKKRLAARLSGQFARAAAGVLVTGPDDLPSDWSDADREAFFCALSLRPSARAKEPDPFVEPPYLARPFLSLGTEGYLLVDPLYFRLCVERRLELGCSDEDRVRILRRRDRRLEQRAHDILCSVIRPDVVARCFYLPTGPEGALAEHDLLLKAGDVVFLVEAKAKQFRDPRRAPGVALRVRGDLNASVLAADDQSFRAEEYLKGQIGVVDLLDKRGTPAARIELSGNEDYFRIAFIGNYVWGLPSNLALWLDARGHHGYPWVVDEFTLDTIISHFRDASHLAEFLTWRLELTGRAVVMDEAVFAGAFLTHGPIDWGDDAATIMLDESYTDRFDYARYTELGLDVPAPKADATPSLVTMKRDGDVIDLRGPGGLGATFNIREGKEVHSEKESQSKRRRWKQRRRKKRRR